MNRFYTNLYIFFRQSIFAYRALFGLIRPRDYLLIKILEPVLQVVLFSVLGTFAGKDPAYFALGNAIRVASASGLFGCVSVMENERRCGTLLTVTASATPIAQTFIARSILQGLDGLTTVASSFLVGVLFFGLNFSQVHWGWMLLALIVTSYAISGLGILIATTGLLGIDVNYSMNFLYYALIVMCGVNFPVQSFPPAIQLVAKMLPLTHGLEAIRSIVAGNLEGVPQVILIEAGLGLAYGILGYFMFRYVEFRARVLGTLEMV
jgi:ABC-2 type transport system permease protein